MSDDRRHPDDEHLRADDEHLRADFAALREELGSSGGVPDFEAMLDRAKGEASSTAPAGGGEVPAGAAMAGKRSTARPSPLRRWLPLAAAAAVATILLVGRLGAPSGASDPDADFERLVADYSASASAGAWRSPTASLMRIPGVDLGAVPDLGSSVEGWLPPDRDGPGGRDS